MGFASYRGSKGLGKQQPSWFHKGSKGNFGFKGKQKSWNEGSFGRYNHENMKAPVFTTAGLPTQRNGALPGFRARNNDLAFQNKFESPIIQSIPGMRGFTKGYKGFGGIKYQLKGGRRREDRLGENAFPKRYAQEVNPRGRIITKRKEVFSGVAKRKSTFGEREGDLFDRGSRKIHEFPDIKGGFTGGKAGGKAGGKGGGKVGGKAGGKAGGKGWIREHAKGLGKRGKLRGLWMPLRSRTGLDGRGFRGNYIANSGKGAFEPPFQQGSDRTRWIRQMK